MIKVLSGGQVLPTYEWQGRLFLEGSPGSPFRFRLRNPTRVRILIVLTVDGENVIDGKPGSFGGLGFIAAPGQSLIVPGFIVSGAECAPFAFSDKGVFGAAVFYEDPTASPRSLRQEISSRAFQHGPRDPLYSEATVFHRATQVPQKVFKIQYASAETLVRWRVPIPSQPPQADPFPAEVPPEFPWVTREVTSL